MYSMVCSVLAPRSCQLDTGLFFNALQSSYGDVPFRVRDRHTALFRRVFELLVAADLIHFVPVILPQGPDNFPTLHPGSSLHPHSSIIHTLYTPVKARARIAEPVRCPGSAEDRPRSPRGAMSLPFSAVLSVSTLIM